MLELLPGDIVKCTWINESISECYAIVLPLANIYDDALAVDAAGAFFYLLTDIENISKHIKLEIL